VNLIHHLLERQARRAPHSTFLIEVGASYPFAAVEAMSRGIAANLQAGGLRKGDRVGLVMANSVALVASVFGVLRAGGVVVPMNPDTTAERLTAVLDDCTVSVVIAHTTTRAVVDAAVLGSGSVTRTIWDGPTLKGETSLADLADDRRTPLAEPRLIDQDLALIIYTSGSTGASKGVMLSHLNVCSSAASIASYLGNTPDDMVLVGSLVGYAVMIERSFAFPIEVMGRLAANRVTGVPGVPSMFSAILRTPGLEALDLSAVRYLTNAADALPKAHIPRLRSLFGPARLFCMYGLTECTRVSYLDPDRLTDKAGSVGTAIPNMEAFVVAPDGRPAGSDEIGELVVRGSGVMLGYWNRPRETAAAVYPGPLLGDRLLRSGDLFRTDADGFLWFVGRKDDVFKTRGEKVSPKEVEGVIYELESVAEVAVIGVPHDVDGLAVKAFVVPRSGATIDEATVRRYCRGRLPSHLVPRFVDVRSSLPRTQSGKIRKTDLV
jgi:long-chain acyl-CoA synthetase